MKVTHIVGANRMISCDSSRMMTINIEILGMAVNEKIAEVVLQPWFCLRSLNNSETVSSPKEVRRRVICACVVTHPHRSSPLIKIHCVF
jgi:hypothetical protein